MRSRTRKISLLVGAVVATTLVGAAAAVAAPAIDNGWPYDSAPTAHDAETYTLAAVGDIACEPDDDENASTPGSLKCGSPSLGGYDAEFATAKQTEAMKPDAVALLGDEQYEVGKLSDFEASFEQAWGGLKFLERPAPGNHEYYPYVKKGDNEAGQNGSGYFAYFNGHDQSGTPNTSGQAGDDTEGAQGWYSYDLGNWHIVSLNVECNSPAFQNDCSTTDGGLLAQETRWLAADLKSNQQQCTIAYWHQPTFSSTTASTATVPASAVGAGGQEGQVADAWWKLLYANHATLVLNGHEHAYARLKPMDPTGAYDPKKGIPEFIVGTGGEALDTLAKNADGSFANPNVVTGYDQGFGTMKLTLKQHGYSFSYAPALQGPGLGTSALAYSDSGSGDCRG
ncbi:metallophosphoesterase [Leifsonia sp. fls2-241-R2A-40a]|uniref:metallophosphoesterase family protein n=1 Tax=Leifsonia sp. fls2-241-R2A-40a TaxID=3040290 RepID=UPI002551486D|nr:metallophosphoesterase [Leifsonia sp. fls2-241-R2A-40a]